MQKSLKHFNIDISFTEKLVWVFNRMDRHCFQNEISSNIKNPHLKSYLKPS